MRFSFLAVFHQMSYHERSHSMSSEFHMTCRNSILCCKGFYRKISTGFECSILRIIYPVLACQSGQNWSHPQFAWQQHVHLEFQEPPAAGARSVAYGQRRGCSKSDQPPEFGVHGVMRECETRRQEQGDHASRCGSRRRGRATAPRR